MTSHSTDGDAADGVAVRRTVDAAAASVAGTVTFNSDADVVARFWLFCELMSRSVSISVESPAPPR